MAVIPEVLNRESILFKCNLDPLSLQLNPANVKAAGAVQYSLFDKINCIWFGIFKRKSG